MEDLKRYIREVPDFPKPGIQFKDITPVLADPHLFSSTIDLLTESFKPGDVDAVVGIDARDGRVKTRGWLHDTAVTPADLGRQRIGHPLGRLRLGRRGRTGHQGPALGLHGVGHQVVHHAAEERPVQ